MTDNRLRIMSFALLCMAFLSDCRTSGNQLTKQLSLWIDESRLSKATDEEIQAARSSEISWSNDQALIGSELRLSLHRGELLGRGLFSTTSYYELTNSKGQSLAKIPSRFYKKMDPDVAQQSQIRVWASNDLRLLVVYESLSDATGDREIHSIIHQDPEESWSARGVEVPRWRDRSDELRIAKEKNVPLNPTFHEGPALLGVSNGMIIILPVKGVEYRVVPDGLKTRHPFPFDIG